MKFGCRRLLIRADASPAIGTGHIMRCLALTQAWQDSGGEAVLVTAENLDGLHDRVEAEGLMVHRLSATPGGHEDVRDTTALARETGSDWIVIDGYHFTGRYQRRLKDAGFRLLVVDDYGHADHYSA